MLKSFQYNGSEIFYNVAGNGKPVVLLHGFAEDGNIWNEQVAFLEHDCRVIVPDLPGSGKSNMLKQADVTIEDYAACLAALLQNENLDTCILLGHSLGGYITLAFAQLYPEKLTGFGLVHSTAFADSEDKKATRKKAIGIIEEYGAYSFIKNTIPGLFADKYKKQHPEQIAAFIERGKGFSAEALIQYYTAMMNRADSKVVLANSAVPVLFIIGSEDVAAPLADLLHQVHLPKKAYIYIIDGVGHMSMWEAPGELNKHLLAFVKDAE